MRAAFAQPGFRRLFTAMSTSMFGDSVMLLVVLPLLLVRDAGDVWIVYAVAFCYGISFVVLPAATNGLLQEMMPEEQLVDANSSLQTVKEGYRLVGPLIGAGLLNRCCGTCGWRSR